MKSFAAAIVLILMQAGPAGSETSYNDFIGKADLIIVAWMDHAELDAVKEKTNWTVVYRVKEVLKGTYQSSELTLRFDSTSLERVDLSGRGTNEQHKLLILFLRRETGGGFRYIGPPLNSPDIMATSANIAAFRRVLAEEPEKKTAWLDTVLPGGIAGYALIGAIIVVLIALIAVIRRRPKHIDHSSDTQ